MVNPSRGEIYWINLDPAIGTEIKKRRPCLIVSNNQSNQYYGQITVIPLTSKKVRQAEPFQLFLPAKETGLDKDSKALSEQIRTVSKMRLATYIGRVSDERMKMVDSAIKIHLDLT